MSIYGSCLNMTVELSLLPRMIFNTGLCKQKAAIFFSFFFLQVKLTKCHVMSYTCLSNWSDIRWLRSQPIRARIIMI